MNDTNGQGEQEQLDTHNPQQIAYVYRSRSVNNRSSNNCSDLTFALACLQANEEEEQIVTSTSSDTISTVARLPHLETLITSPARITSSTGNDCSSSPQRILSTNSISVNTNSSQDNINCRQNSNTNDITTSDASSEDESQSPKQSVSSFAGIALESSCVGIRSVDRLHGDMPTTSAVLKVTPVESQVSLRFSQSNCSNKALGGSTTRATPAINSSISIFSNGNLESNLNGLSDMVTRETATLAGGNSIVVSVSSNPGTSGANDTTSSNSSMSEQMFNSSDNHKIRIKLPKPSAPCSAQNNESHTNEEPISSSGYNSASTDCVRKVEPLKINLHAHHSTNVVPKITIKPIKKQNDIPSSDCSSSAEDDVITDAAAHNSSHQRVGSQSKISFKSSTMGLDVVGNEPHIVPKLTIRSANEDGGAAHSSIVPKLTIKMPDNQPVSLCSSQTSQTIASVGCGPNTHSTQKSFLLHSPPPLPKLTIKTSLDGTSESIMSTISPASSSSSSSSASSAGVSSLSSATTSCVISNTPSASIAVPKLTIKTVSKSDEVVPKLTIKTNASGSCVSKSLPIDECADESGASSSKIPKLTIKTGQEHAVIITQHNNASNAQIIPKMTIKTKSLDAEESLSDLSEEPPPEKIPKITIKTNDILTESTQQKFCIKAQQQQVETDTPHIPKLTISVSNLESGGAPHSPKQSPLVVRQLTTTTRNPESPERLPKLMISRQESSSCSEKLVPKLTIKTNNMECGEFKETPSKFTIKQNSSHEEEKIPKLTIKSMPSHRQSSEESDECLSGDYSPIPSTKSEASNKVVPKLTIMNLSSPKLKMKAVLEDKSRATSSHTASKKCAKPDENISIAEIKDGSIQVNVSPVQKTGTNNPPEGNVPENMVNGESSNSQEFCGFNNDNTTESNVDRIENTGHAEAEAPQRYCKSDGLKNKERLQQHHAQVFNNVAHFNNSNGETFIMRSSIEMEADNRLMQPPKHCDNSSLVVDTVDLTSSPSPGSSPAHFTYTDADPQILPIGSEQHTVHAGMLMERLRETSVIQTVPSLENRSFLLSQLTAPINPVKYGTPPPLQPKPSQPQQQQLSNSVKYPQLTERLMANGAHVAALNLMLNTNTTNIKISAPVLDDSPATGSIGPNKVDIQQQKVIDSIEILDSPEGSPRSTRGDATTDFVHSRELNLTAGLKMYEEDSLKVLRRNKNLMDALLHNQDDSEAVNQLKRRSTESSLVLENEVNDQCMELTPNKVRRIGSDSHTMATLTILTNDESLDAKLITTSPTIIGNNHCVDIRDETATGIEMQMTLSAPKQQLTPQSTHRSRKQRHEHLLSIPMDEVDPLNYNLNDVTSVAAVNNYEAETKLVPSTPTTEAGAAEDKPVVRRRGRPKKNANNVIVSTQEIPNIPVVPPAVSTEDICDSPIQALDEEIESLPPTDSSSKSRRVQLLRKRLAIDMVDAEQPTTMLKEVDSSSRNVGRVSRRSVLTTPLQSPGEKQKSIDAGVKQRKRVLNSNNIAGVISYGMEGMSVLNHYGGSNSSISSACSSSSLSSTAVTTAAAYTSTCATAIAGTGSGILNSTAASISLATQIDLTMCSSSSSTSNGSTTATVTTVGAGSANIVQSQGTNSMLPPTTILSSSDPVPDMVFRPNDFSSFVATKELRASYSSANMGEIGLLGEDDDSMGGNSGADISGDDSTTSSTSMNTPVGRGRGRGSRGGRGGRGSTRGVRGHRLGRGASAVAKAIALNRPRCMGGLKHTPDPERLKGLFSPSPQVFEEDTRMSADLNQNQAPVEPQTPTRQPDFLNNEESQSSVVSTGSILDPNTIPAVQNGSATKRPKKKKMEVCISEEAEFTVASIAEYEWPPPKGCCPSKNRDAFMIQEQVTQYLGIKSFKRKYPDLPRRQIDMEERNWLQEKGLVSEKMCDLGITAVWASDILDIMYTDFHDKYEEYKDFIRQKHLREIEAKQKALGLNVLGRGLQARDRAMLSTTKWNAYFNKSRKDERVASMDLQTLTVNVPLPATAPATTMVNRPIAEAVAAAAKSENIAEPPTLLKPRITEPKRSLEASYPVALFPDQYCAEYRHYTSAELNFLPINTVIEDPRNLVERLFKRMSTVEMNTSNNDIEGVESRTDINDTLKTTDANKATTCDGSDITSVRFPVRRSRRARTAASMRCDAVKRETDAEQTGHAVKSERDSASDSSSSEETGSESDSDSDASSVSSLSSEEENETVSVCGVCQRPQHCNARNLPELFICCYTCRQRVHPSCVEMPHRMVARVRNYNWQCADCKCCIKCKRKQDQNKMLFCEQCDRGFHIYCLGIKSVPDGRWSCERCSFCLRCGATKPEGLPQAQQSLFSPNGEKIKQVKHKKVKWINEYRIDHITKLREHCSMLCVPCGRAKTTKRVQIASPSSSNALTNNLPPPIPQQSQMTKVQTQPAVIPQNMQQTSSLATATATSNEVPAVMEQESTSAAGAAETLSASTGNGIATGTLPPPPVVA